MQTLNKISDIINRICGWFLIACFSVMTVVYFGQIVLRYALQTGFDWTEELTRYTNIAMVMVGAAMIAGKNGHINVTILETLLSEKAKRILIVVQQMITATFFGVSIKIGFDMMALAGTQVSTNMRIPMMYVYAIFPIAFTLLVLQVMVYVLNSLITLKEVK